MGPGNSVEKSNTNRLLSGLISPSAMRGRLPYRCSMTRKLAGNPELILQTRLRRLRRLNIDCVHSRFKSCHRHTMIPRYAMPTCAVSASRAFFIKARQRTTAASFLKLTTGRWPTSSSLA